MIEGFDKEMDALLRQAARGETASANPKSHLDADEISLFAENALPERVKLRFTEHFADCDRCRKILSNVISLNSEIAKEIVHAPETAQISIAAPWYRRLFAVPNLAYAMGALLLVFASLVAFTFLRNPNDSQNAEIAQVESTENMRGPNAGGDAPVIESNAAAMSNASSMMSNSSMSNSNSATSNASATNSATVSATNAGSMSNGASVSTSAATVNKQTDKKNEAAKNEAQNTADSIVARNDKTISDASGASFAEQKKQPTTEEKTRAADDNEAIQSDAPAPKPQAPAATRSAPAELPVNGRTASSLNSMSAKKSKSDAAETRAAGGKTFKRENGVWYDANYRGQATTNVLRGSADFKKLDSGLRSIAGNLSGTIVVVYQGKAYRIQ